MPIHYRVPNSSTTLLQTLFGVQNEWRKEVTKTTTMVWNDFLMRILVKTLTLLAIGFERKKKCSSLLQLKVSKFQKQIFLLSFEPKNEWNYFLYFRPKDLK